MGAIYKRGKVFWISFYRNGKQLRESVKSLKESDAKRLLKKREGEVEAGKLPGSYFDKVSFDELAREFLTEYKVNKRKSIDKAERSINHLKTAFEGFRITEVTTPRINSYTEQRLSEGAENGTINRELAALKRMFNLGARQTPPKVDRVPYIPMLKENNVRKGFFEHGDFLALRENLPDYLKGFVTFGYKTGWRYSEISNLTWSQVELDKGIVKLETGETKNDEGRTVYLDNELKELFLKQKEARKGAKKIMPYVFLNGIGTDRIKDIRGAWANACKKANLMMWDEEKEMMVPSKMFHDFRRTAVRNMVRAGIPERVAMMISGHKTRSVFERYNIVSDTDLILASQKQETYLQAQSSTKTSTVENIDKKRGQAPNA